MAKIALDVERALERRRALGEPGGTAVHVLGRGEGWRVEDVVCTSGPRDRPFEEQHTHYAIAVVLAGTFQYRAPAGEALMTPGALMLGNSGECFECGHEHGEGDRCVAFSYAPEYLDRLAADVGHRGGRLAFPVVRIPPLRALTPAVAAAGASVLGWRDVCWEELGVRLAARAIRLAAGVSASYRAPRNAEARVTRSIRMIDRHPDGDLRLGSLAREAGLSPYYFLRTFQRLTGITPHQYVLRGRMREAAMRLSAEEGKVLDIAFDCGFGDVSNFNRTFRAEFGVSPRAYQQR